jgi:predicted O-methyltransferase YrrM
MSGTSEGPLALSPLSWSYADSWGDEPAPVAAARTAAATWGCTPVSKGTASLLRVLAAAAGAKHIVEVGTGTGVSGAALLSGMDGVLTTIDTEAGPQGVARETFANLGISHTRYRLITGAGADVLTRLSDASYDVVFLDTPQADQEQLISEAARLLRPGGILALTGALEGSRTGAAAITDDYLAALVPLGNGLVVAVRRADTGDDAD